MTFLILAVIWESNLCSVYLMMKEKYGVLIAMAFSYFHF